VVVVALGRDGDSTAVSAIISQVEADENFNHNSQGSLEAVHIHFSIFHQ